MPIITVFDYFKRPVQYLPLVNVLHQIKTATYFKQIKQLRQYYTQDSGMNYDHQVKVIPRFSVSGNFRVVEDQLKLISYSGNLLLEIPYLNTRDLKTVRMLLTNDPFVQACFENALGTGLVFIVNSNSNVEEHSLMFRSAVKYYEYLTGVKRFSKNGVSYEHTVMVSQDAHTYISQEAVPFSDHIKALVNN